MNEELVAELVAALSEFGRHKRGCSIFPRDTRHHPQCSCGLSDVLAKAKGAQ